MNYCNCATSYPECKRCGLKCYPTPDTVEQLKKQNAELLQWCSKQTLFIRKVADTVPEKGSEYWAIQSEACDLVKEANERFLE